MREKVNNTNSSTCYKSILTSEKWEFHCERFIPIPAPHFLTKTVPWQHVRETICFQFLNKTYNNFDLMEFQDLYSHA